MRLDDHDTLCVGGPPRRLHISPSKIEIWEREPARIVDGHRRSIDCRPRNPVTHVRRDIDNAPLAVICGQADVETYLVGVLTEPWRRAPNSNGGVTEMNGEPITVGFPGIG